MTFNDLLRTSNCLLLGFDFRIGRELLKDFKSLGMRLVPKS